MLVVRLHEAAAARCLLTNVCGNSYGYFFASWRESYTVTHYRSLGVAPEATREEIRQAFVARQRELREARESARSPAQRARIEAERRAVQAAWDIVGHAARRRAYDRHLREQQVLPPPERNGSQAHTSISPLLVLLVGCAAIVTLLQLPEPSSLAPWTFFALSLAALWVSGRPLIP